MSESGTEQPTNQSPGPNEPNPATAKAQKERNTVGLIALIVAAIGFVFACIPGALIVGWILLPTAFVLSIVGLALSEKTKGTSVTALIVSIIGVIVGVLVFFTVVANAFDDAVEENSADVTSAADSGKSDSDRGGADDSDSGDKKDAAKKDGDKKDEKTGTRDNPAELGSTISGKNWDVTIDSFDTDATEDVLAENPMNEEPDSGDTYGVAEATVSYTGDDSQDPLMDVQIAYVTEKGTTVDGSEKLVVGPSPRLDDVGDMYEGASETGNVTLEIPKDDDGLLRVTPGMMSDEVFVSTN